MPSFKTDRKIRNSTSVLQNELNSLVSAENDLAENEQVAVTKRVISFSRGFRRYVFLAFWLFGILIFRPFNFSAFHFFGVLTFGLFIIRPLDFWRFHRDPNGWRYMKARIWSRDFTGTAWRGREHAVNAKRSVETSALLASAGNSTHFTA